MQERSSSTEARAASRGRKGIFVTQEHPNIMPYNPFQIQQQQFIRKLPQPQEFFNPYKPSAAEPKQRRPSALRAQEGLQMSRGSSGVRISHSTNPSQQPILSMSQTKKPSGDSYRQFKQSRVIELSQAIDESNKSKPLSQSNVSLIKFQDIEHIVTKVSVKKIQSSQQCSSLVQQVWTQQQALFNEKLSQVSIKISALASQNSKIAKEHKEVCRELDDALQVIESLKKTTNRDRQKIVQLTKQLHYLKTLKYQSAITKQTSSAQISKLKQRLAELQGKSTSLLKLSQKVQSFNKMVDFIKVEGSGIKPESISNLQMRITDIQQVCDRNKIIHKGQIQRISNQFNKLVASIVALNENIKAVACQKFQCPHSQLFLFQKQMENLRSKLERVSKLQNLNEVNKSKQLVSQRKSTQKKAERPSKSGVQQVSKFQLKHEMPKQVISSTMQKFLSTIEQEGKVEVVLDGRGTAKYKKDGMFVYDEEGNTFRFQADQLQWLRKNKHIQ